ncbi:MAG: Dyp-type peroxidase [SAR86 cluster bacterium]
MAHQTGIALPVPQQSRYLYYSLNVGAHASELMAALEPIVDGEAVVLGLGKAFVDLLGATRVKVQDAPVYSNAGIAIGAAPYALWIWLRGSDRGDLAHLTLQIQEALGDHAVLEDLIDGFCYQKGKDLTGYIDGTENPEGDEIQRVGFDAMGGSCVAVQKWVHDLGYFTSLSPQEQDAKIGRHKHNNEEFDAPKSAHVIRAAQETYSPEANLLRRSMPWADFSGEGLVFVAFAKEFYAFDAILKRMIGLEDGITDALFTFSRPLTTSFFWCPPMRKGKPDFGVLSGK